MRGFPCMVVSDNGTELTSNAMLKCDAGDDDGSIAFVLRDGNGAILHLAVTSMPSSFSLLSRPRSG